MEKQKVVFIPGFMDVAANFTDTFSGLDIWKERIDWNDPIDADVVVGYSLGANFALLNWARNKDTKLVLVNPLVPKRPLTEWAKRWVSFFSAEGMKVNKRRSKILVQFPLNTKLAVDILSEDVGGILETIPKEKIITVRGVRDDFFCDAEAGEYLKKKGIVLHETESGHTWNKNMAERTNALVKEFLHS